MSRKVAVFLSIILVIVIIAVIGGIKAMQIGTLFTLYVLPSVYMLMAKDHAATNNEAYTTETIES